MAADLSGNWFGSAEGSTAVVMQAQLRQQSRTLSGVVMMTEPQIGSYLYQVNGDVSDTVRMRLTPATPGIDLGEVNVEAENHGTFLAGKWQSTNGHRGVFTLKPQAFAPVSRKVFVVHGHDLESRDLVASLLSRLDLEPVVLDERPNQGRTIIEKIEANRVVRFAVVLLTPDDRGGSRDDTLRDRARQNVVLELGYFLGCLGRANVCALKKGDIEIPSDFHGVLYVPFDANGDWRRRLANEILAAGIEIHLDRLMTR